jgi:hypothetical protein
MSTLGVFRDDFYNSISVLAAAQYTATAQASGVLAGAAMAGAEQCFVLTSGATALTTDSAVNIIAALQNAVAVAVKTSQANGGGFATGLGVPNNPSLFPNLFNLAWTLVIENTNAGVLTLTAGTGVTLVGVATVTNGTQRTWVVTITSPTTVNMQTVGQQVTAP